MDKKPIGNTLDFMKGISPIESILFPNNKAHTDSKICCSFAHGDCPRFGYDEMKDSNKSAGAMMLKEGVDKKIVPAVCKHCMQIRLIQWNSLNKDNTEPRPTNSVNVVGKVQRIGYESRAIILSQERLTSTNMKPQFIMEWTVADLITLSFGMISFLSYYCNRKIIRCM